MTEPTIETNTETNDGKKRPLWPIVTSAVVALVILSFGGSFVGTRMALSAPETVGNEVENSTPELNDSEPSTLPAGADVRAGAGIPDPAYGKEGDIFIDIETADVFVRTSDGWTHAMDIRTAARENLIGKQGKTGEQGEQGKAGKPGEQGSTGEQGAPGLDGSQVILGLKPPTGQCGVNEVFIDTAAVTFYYCTDGKWAASAR